MFGPTNAVVYVFATSIAEAREKRDAALVLGATVALTIVRGSDGRGYWTIDDETVFGDCPVISLGRTRALVECDGQRVFASPTDGARIRLALTFVQGS